MTKQRTRSRPRSPERRHLPVSNTSSKLMRHVPITRCTRLLLLGALSAALGACAVVTVAGAAAGAVISVAGAVVTTGVTVTGAVIEKTVDAVAGGGEAKK